MAIGSQTTATDPSSDERMSTGEQTTVKKTLPRSHLKAINSLLKKKQTEAEVKEQLKQELSNLWHSLRRFKCCQKVCDSLVANGIVPSLTSILSQYII